MNASEHEELRIDDTAKELEVIPLVFLWMDENSMFLCAFKFDTVRISPIMNILAAFLAEFLTDLDKSKTRMFRIIHIQFE